MERERASLEDEVFGSTSENEKTEIEEAENDSFEELDQIDRKEELEQVKEIERQEEKIVQEDLDYEKTAIQGSLYQYMIDNHEKVFKWIEWSSRTPACRSKFVILQESTIFSQEDLVQETYTRILKTFYDNEQRLIKCRNCSHQCKEFLNKTKKTNTEKAAEGEECRPYMHYNFTEKMLHNYIKHSMVQNIDIKLKKLKNSRGERVVVKLSESIGNDADSCTLEDILIDALETSTSDEAIKNLLDKKLVFTNKLAAFELTKPVDFEEYRVIPNPMYNEKTEKLKEETRKKCKKLGIVPLRGTDPEPIEFETRVPRDLQEIDRDLMKKFNKFPGKAFKFNSEDTLKERANLDHEFFTINLIESEEECHDRKTASKLVSLAEKDAKLAMLEFMPSIQELASSCDDVFENYAQYLSGWQDSEEEELSMEYTDRTHIRIVDKDEKIVPLPLCMYAEVTIRDFLNICLDMKNNSSYFNRIFAGSKHECSFKEYWVNFENKEYSICENIEHVLSSSKRKRLYRFDKMVRCFNTKNMSSTYQNAQKILKNTPTLVDKLDKNFIARVLKEIKECAIQNDCGKYVETVKMTIPVQKKIRLTPKEREERAKLELSKILEREDRIRNNDIYDINTAVEDTSLTNLKPQELYQALLEKIPRQEKKYVLEKVKVLCTTITHTNQKNVVSI